MVMMMQGVPSDRKTINKMARMAATTSARLLMQDRPGLRLALELSAVLDPVPVRKRKRCAQFVPNRFHGGNQIPSRGVTRHHVLR